MLHVHFPPRFGFLMRNCASNFFQKQFNLLVGRVNISNGRQVDVFPFHINAFTYGPFRLWKVTDRNREMFQTKLGDVDMLRGAHI
jgi:hypothetical protein